MKLKAKEPFSIIVGSTVQDPNGKSLQVKAGQEFEAQDTTTWSSNVWITFDNIRGKRECGTWRNLVNNGYADIV